MTVMSRFELRPYQAACVEAVLAKFREFRRLLVVVPTAGGKTVIFSELARRTQPTRTLILAHREELLAQAADKLHRSRPVWSPRWSAPSTARVAMPPSSSRPSRR
jgi:superfamily II DNA or RNA helicase